MKNKTPQEILTDIAKAYRESKLDEWRPEWGQCDPSKIELVNGRGGGCLLTLEDCLNAEATSDQSR